MAGNRTKGLRPPWPKGYTPNPAGRPIGNRNKLSEKFILALHDDFVEHGPKVIAQVREEKPADYLRVIASLLPREMHVKNQNAFEGFTDEQLAETLGAVRTILTARTPTEHGDGKQAPGGDKKLN